jgi:hypothetical protein
MFRNSGVGCGVFVFGRTPTNESDTLVAIIEECRKLLSGSIKYFENNITLKLADPVSWYAYNSRNIKEGALA